MALLVSLFAPWYGPSRSGWQSLAALDVLLALVAAAGVLLAVVTATQAAPAVPIALAAIVTLIGLLGVVLVLLRVLDVPDGAGGREWGLWLGLGGAIGIVAGGIVSMREERWPGAEEARVEFVPAPRP